MSGRSKKSNGELWRQIGSSSFERTTTHYPPANLHGESCEIGTFVMEVFGKGLEGFPEWFAIQQKAVLFVEKSF